MKSQKDKGHIQGNWETDQGHSLCLSFSSPSTSYQGLSLSSSGTLEYGVQHFTPGCGALYLWGILGFQEQTRKSKGDISYSELLLNKCKGFLSNTEMKHLDSGTWWPGFKSSSMTVLIRESTIINNITPKYQRLNIIQVYWSLRSLYSMLAAKSLLHAVIQGLRFLPSPGALESGVREEWSWSGGVYITLTH